MSKLETAQKIGETSTKIFDKIEDNDKKEGFNNLIDELEENNTIKRLREAWNLLNEEQKLKIYKRHSISIGTWFRYANLPTYWLIEKIYNTTKNAVTKGDNHTGEYAALEEIPCRFLVQLGVFDKPKGLDDKKLKEDIQKDAKNINLYLGLCQAACLAIPEAGPEISGLIAIARHYTKWYKKEGAKVIIERLNKNKKTTIIKQTNQDLTNTMSDNKKIIKKSA